MPSQKRSASPTCSPPPAKESKTENPPSGFPNFDDGDVVISVGGLELNLHKKILCDKCSYFAELNCTDTRFPERFTLQPTTCPDQTLAFAVVLPANSNRNDDVEVVNDDNKAHMKRACAANEVIFRLLYQQQISCTKPADFHDAAALATRYGCVNTVKEALALAILKVSLQAKLFQDDPSALLNAAYHLRDKSIFSEAFVHLVGQGGDDEDLLPDAVAELVKEHVSDLKTKVNNCWRMMMRCCVKSNIPGLLAAALVRNYIDQRITFLGSPLRREVYLTLVALYRMDSINPLLDAGLVTRVDDVEKALVCGQRDEDDDYECRKGYEYDYLSHIRYTIDRGLDQCVNTKSLEGELRTIAKGIKAILKPLFENSKGVDYFTCIEFKGPFPWSDTPSNTPP